MYYCVGDVLLSCFAVQWVYPHGMGLHSVTPLFGSSPLIHGICPIQMAFNVSYYDLLHKNIRHIYSSLPSNIRFRSDPQPGVTLHAHDGCLSLPKRVQEHQHQRSASERLRKRFWAYSPKYGCIIARAPAFRCVSSDQASAIVNRVSRTTNTHRRPLVTCQREIVREEHDSCPTCVLSMQGRRCKSAREMSTITKRVSTPTTATKVRSDLREGHGLEPVEVVSRLINKV